MPDRDGNTLSAQYVEVYAGATTARRDKQQTGLVQSSVWPATDVIAIAILRLHHHHALSIVEPVLDGLALLGGGA